MKTIHLALFGLGLIAAQPALAQNLLINGGFDGDAVPAGGYTIYSAGDTIGGGGWTVLGSGGNSGLTLSTTYAEPNVLFSAQSGPVSADLTAAGNTGLANGVAQAIATTSGAVYNLSFFLGNADGSGNANYVLPSAISVTIDGVSFGTFTNAATTLNTINWALFSFNFTAQDGSTLIQFNNATPGSDNFAGLDTVSVTAAVPEPAAWALMIGGFGLVGGAARRRKTRATVAFA